jgi:hypothetical protein
MWASREPPSPDSNPASAFIREDWDWDASGLKGPSGGEEDPPLEDDDGLAFRFKGERFDDGQVEFAALLGTSSA